MKKKRMYLFFICCIMYAASVNSEDTLSASGIKGGDGVLDTIVPADSMTPAPQSDASMPVAATNDEETVEKSDRAPVDILVDLGIGITVPKFYVKPDYIGTESKPRFMFNAGVEIPVGNFLYTAIAVQYMQISSDFSHSDTLKDIFPIVMQATTNLATETHTYVSIPIKVGARFGQGAIIPSIYAVIEPAFLGSAHQLISKEVTTLFDDSTTLYHPPKPSDIETTGYRQRFQIFAGAGIGAEISYGYGYIYLDAGLRYGLRDTDTADHPDSSPKRIESKLLYFPIGLGIRFYL